MLQTLQLKLQVEKSQLEKLMLQRLVVAEVDSVQYQDNL